MAEVVKDVEAVPTSDEVSADVKKVVVSNAVIEVNAETVGCDCGGWHLSLHKSQTSQVAPSLSKPVASENKDSK